MKRAVVALVGWENETGTVMGDHLERRGFVLRAEAEALMASRLIEKDKPDIVVLGPTLARAALLDLLAQASDPQAPFFVVVARSGDLVERVLALEAGASDIIEPNIAPREFAARISGLAHRRGLRRGELIMLERATVDLSAALVMHHSGREEQLSPGQVTLLRLFAARPRTVLSREEIIATAPAEDTDAFDRSIDSRIARLRRKLDTDTIATVRGSGYRFDPPGR